MAKSNPKPPAKPKAPAKPAVPAASLEALVADKVAAGLPRHQALEVAKNQLAHDAALAAAEAGAEGSTEEAADADGEPAEPATT